MRSMSSWLVVAFLAGAGSALAEDTKVVEATGEAAIGSASKLIAKDKATEDALRKAVEQVCGVLVSADTKVEGNQLISDKILTQAKGYVQKFEVLSSREDKGVVAVTIRAVVGKGKLEGDLEAAGLTLARKGMPRLAILIEEQRIDEVKPAAWWGKSADPKAPVAALKVDQRVAENTVVGEWTKLGFLFVDPEAVATKARTAGITSIDLAANKVRELGDLSEADVVLLGTALATKMQDQSKLLEGVSHGAEKLTGVTCNSTVSVRAFNADNGEILAAGEASAPAFGESTLSCGRDAMVKASRKLSAELQKDLLAAWNRQLTNGGRVRLKFSGIDSMSTLNQLKTGLAANVRGVKAVSQKTYKNGVADLDVVIAGSVDELGTELETWKLGKRKVKVLSMSPNQVELELQK